MKRYGLNECFLGKVTNDNIVNGTFIIPDTVEYIDSEAFKDCDFLKFIKLPNSVRSIGRSAFENCINLKSIDMSSNIYEIGKGAFKNCKALTDITIPTKVDIINEEVFEGCHSLKKISILGHLLGIEQRAFAYCHELKKLYISKDTKYVFLNAFLECNKLNLKLETSLLMLLLSVSGFTNALADLNFEKLKMYDDHITGREASTRIEGFFLVTRNRPYESVIIEFIRNTRRGEIFDIIKNKLYENGIKKKKYLQYSEHKKFINEILEKIVKIEKPYTYNTWGYYFLGNAIDAKQEYMEEINNYVKRYVKSCVEAKDIKLSKINKIDDNIISSKATDTINEISYDNIDMVSNSIIDMDDSGTNIELDNVVEPKDDSIKNISDDIIEQENKASEEVFNYQNILKKLSELPNDEIALIMDMIKNNLFDENLERYMNMTRKEKLEFFKNESTKPYKVSLEKEPIEVYKARQKQKQGKDKK